jgi:hypothetical protein
VVFAFGSFFGGVGASGLRAVEANEQVSHLVSLAKRIGANVTYASLGSLLV